MRNLKRVLSLALASIMLLGMMVIGASAADTKVTLSDMDQITNKEAVNLMVDLGIILGKPDGSYAPAETIDRATMANLITKIVMGNVDASLFEGTKTDLTDIDSSWARGYIKYCYANDIITGDGIGHFFPTNKVKVVEAAKMLLVAIGYDADAQGYVGNNWSINIMRDAKTAGLLEGISASTNDDLTRDNAAQMIFNTLFAPTITYTTQYDGGKAYKTDPTNKPNGIINKALGELQFDLKKIEATVTGINSDGTAATTLVAPTTPAENTLINGKLPGTPDLVGSNVVAYYNTNTNKLYSTALSAGSSVILGTSTDGTPIASLTTKGNRKYIASEKDGGATVYQNGVQQAATVNIGSVVELVDNDKDGLVDVVRVTNKSVSKLAAAPVISGDTVTITSIPGLSKINTAKVVGYEDLAKDDVVLYVKLGDTFYIEKAAVVEGVVAAKDNNNKVVVGGTAYEQSGLTGSTFNKVSFVDYTNTYNFYLDNGNNIVMAVAQTSSVTAQYAVLADIALVNNTANGGLTGSWYVEGKLVFTDGTSEVVRIASVNGVEPILTGQNVPGTLYYFNGSVKDTVSDGRAAIDKTYYYSNPTGTTVTAKYFGATNSASLYANSALNVLTNTSTGNGSGTTPFAVRGQFYEFTANSDGAYALKTVSANSATTAALANHVITNGATKFDNTNIGNNSTVFIYAVTGTDGKVTYTTYTGINNVPTTTLAPSNQGDAAVVKNSAGFATYVYVEISSSNVAGVNNTDVVYITSSNYQYYPASGNVPAYYSQSAIVNGVSGTVKLSANETAGTLKSVQSVSNDIYTLTAFTGTNKTGIKGNSGDVLVFADGTTTLSYDDATEVYLISGSPATSTQLTGDSISASATNDVYYQVNGNGVATVIYVVEKSAAPTVLTIGKGTTQVSVTIGQANALASGGATVTAWAAGDQIRVASATAATNTTILSVAINGNAMTVGTTDYTLLSNGTLNLVVTVQDDFSNAITTYSYDIGVSGKV